MSVSLLTVMWCAVRIMAKPLAQTSRDTIYKDLSRELGRRDANVTPTPLEVSQSTDPPASPEAVALRSPSPQSSRQDSSSPWSLDVGSFRNVVSEVLACVHRLGPVRLCSFS